MMNITTPNLEDMSVEQKLRLMEDLWEDLSRNAADLAPPGWHADVLAAREASLEDSQDRFEDWNEARERIERDIQ